MVTIIVTPLGRGQYEARLEGRVLVGSTTEPLLAAARALLAQGVAPETPIAMRHEGADHAALRSTVGKAVRLTVEAGKDGVPRFARFRKGREHIGEGPPIAFCGDPVPLQPSAPASLYEAVAAQPSEAVA